MNDPELKKIDHYLFRHAIGRWHPDGNVGLWGQFEQNWRTVNPKQLVLLGSPTYKRHHGKVTDIRDAELHLTGYTIDTAAQPQREVDVTNQFSEQAARWVIGQPELLLVPAGKRHVGDNAPLLSGQHYACYRVIDGADVWSPIDLQDQFEVQEIHVGRLSPVYLGVPVKKMHGAAISDHVHEIPHLAIYALHQGHNHERTIVRDQFNTQQIEVGLLLGVPSRKKLIRVGT